MSGGAAIARALRLASAVLARGARAIDARAIRSRLVQRGTPRSLYQTRDGSFFWLDPSLYIDRCIAEQGIFEPDAVAVIERLVRPGHTVLDVGANIGFHTVLLARRVGPTGRVLAFEPTAHYRAVLERNVAVNRLSNVEILPIGLSDRAQRLPIEIGASSATLHVPGKARLRAREEIELAPLDELGARLGLERLDFVKVDVDGHEPAFLLGAQQTLAKFAPPVLLEVSHPNYLEAGWTAWDFYRALVAQGYRIYDEVGLAEIASETAFLEACGNFRYSRNIVIARDPLPDA